MHTLKLSNRNKYINISEEKTHINSTKSKQRGIAPFLIGTWTWGIFFLSIWLKSDPLNPFLYISWNWYICQNTIQFSKPSLFGGIEPVTSNQKHIYATTWPCINCLHSTIYIFKKAIPLWEKIFSQLKIKLQTHTII